MATDPLTTGVITSGVINGASQIGSGIIGLVNNKYNKEQNEWNKNFAREQFDYGKYITENAAQIRARDLQKAGLSKNLAAGDSASSQVSVNSKAEQSALNDFDKKIIDNQLMQQLVDIKRTKSEASLNSKRENQIDADISYTNEMKNTETEKQNMYRSQSSWYKSQEDINKHNLDYAQFWKMPTGLSARASNKYELLSSFGQYLIKSIAESGTAKDYDDAVKRYEKKLDEEGIKGEDKKKLMNQFYRNKSAMKGDKDVDGNWIW